MSDRHEKWVHVEPGHIIPVGQPFRIEFDAKEAGYVDGRYGTEYPGPKREKEVVLRDGTDEWFIDSSWRPPLVLPTEPTWGIAVVEAEEDSPIDWIVDRWTYEARKYDSTFRLSGYHTSGLYEQSEVLDFIPLTDEQVARIEAAR